MSAAHDDAEKPPVTTASMRASATWFLDQHTLPHHQMVMGLSQEFRTHLNQLISRVVELTGYRQDSVRRVALVEVCKARWHLEEGEAAGLRGEVERVQRLARSVLSLCDHYSRLTGVAMCLACDKPIEEGEASLPYEQVSQSGNFVPVGFIHSRCGNTVRRHS